MDEWKPKAPQEEEDKVEQAVFAEDIKKYMKRVTQFEDNCCNVFTVVYGQCSESLQAKIREQDNWESIFENNKLLRVMKSIKVWMLNQEGCRSPVAAADAAVAAMYRVRQNRHESLTEYCRRFRAATEVLDHIDIKLEKALVGLADKSLGAEEKKTRKDATTEEIETAESRTLEKFLAYCFIAAADKARFSNVAVYLENEYVAGSDKFPKDITAAYNFLENWKRSTVHVETHSNDGVSFAQADKLADGRRTSRDRSHIQCYRCRKLGHTQHEGKCDPDDDTKCQNRESAKTGTANHMTGMAADSSNESGDEWYRVPMLCTTHMEARECDKNAGHVLDASGEVLESVMTHSFNTTRAYVIPAGSLRLDSMSSVHVFGESRLLTNIRTVRNRMKIVCNAEEVLVTQMGDLGGYGPVWYHADAVANILSLNNVQKRYKIRYDSAVGDFFTMERNDGTTRVFRPTEKCLYASRLVPEPDSMKGASMVTTVDGNAKSFTRREVKRAKQARRLMAIIERPSERHMREIVGQKQLLNCDISEQDVRNAFDIFGPDVGSLKGKTTRRSEPHVGLDMRPVPDDIMKRHREVVVCSDVMYVNGIPFTVSISRALKFGTVEAIKNRKAQTLLNSIKVIQATYARRGFLANRIAADNEFASLEGALSGMGIALNVVSRGEHVPEIERYLRTLKKRCRAVFNTLSFKRIPNRMIVELVYAMNFWLHAFPAQDGVSATMSPREMITGTTIDARKHCKVPFGAYVQTHEEHDNTLATRTIGAIAIRQTGNTQGGHFFYSLMTAQRIVRNSWTEVPMPADVISRVERMAGNREMNRLVFGDRHHDTEAPEEDGDVVSSVSDPREPRLRHQRIRCRSTHA